MRREIFQKIKIPEDVSIEVKGNMIDVKGKEGEIRKIFDIKNILIEKHADEIIVGDKVVTKKEKRTINTVSAHIKNMIKGVQKKFEYKLKVVYSHFPVTVEIHGKEATIKNFLGEKIPRKLEIPEGADVHIQGNEITILSPDIEVAGQAAANFETATRIRLKDRRVFQDGIFITSKAGKEI